MSALTSWNPLRELGSLENRLDRLFGLTSPSRNGEKEAMTVSQWTPLVDIIEDNNEYLVKAELPELKKEEVKVNVENGELTISGERKSEKESKDENEIRVESFRGTFTRSFSLPDDIDPKGIRAESKDGVLKVHIPRTAAPKPGSVSVEVK